MTKQQLINELKNLFEQNKIDYVVENRNQENKEIKYFSFENKEFFGTIYINEIK